MKHVNSEDDHDEEEDNDHRGDYIKNWKRSSEVSVEFLFSAFHFSLGRWWRYWSIWYHDDSLFYELMCFFEMNLFQNISVAYTYHNSITLA